MTNHQLYLAPMEDVTDPAFRMLCKRFGADRVYTEFVNADALVRDIASTTRKLTIHDEERPVAIQIYGREPEAMRDAALIVEQAKPDFIDINFGCPVKKVAGKGAGAGLLRDVPKMLEITRAVVNAVHTPVTAKTRLGWDDADLHPRVNPLNLPKSYSVSGLTGEADHKSVFITDLSLALQDCGIQELAIHGRTRSQMYRGEADWTLIGEVKNNPRMHIPIIGNGDVCTPERAKECFELYGVDAIMVGRATFGAPWLFAEMKEALSYSPKDGLTASAVLQRSGLTAAPPRSMEEKVAVLKEHVLASISWCGNDERKGIVHSRRHFAASPVFKGLFDFKQTRIALLRAETVTEVFAIMDDIVARWGSEDQLTSKPVD
jgi:tRNA-dihydrouridine synthase